MRLRRNCTPSLKPYHMLLYLFIPVSIKCWSNVSLDVGEEQPWAAKGYEASVWLSGLLCMKGHLLSVDLRAFWILIHKDKRIQVRIHSSRLLYTQPILTKKGNISFRCTIWQLFHIFHIQDQRCVVALWFDAVVQEGEQVIKHVKKDKMLLWYGVFLQVPVRLWDIVQPASVV